LVFSSLSREIFIFPNYVKVIHNLFYFLFKKAGFALYILRPFRSVNNGFAAYDYKTFYIISSSCDFNVSDNTYRAGLLLYLFLISVSARVIPDSFHDADVSIGVPVALQKRDINIQFIDWDDQDLVGNLIDGSGNTVSNPTAQVTQEFNFAANLAQVAYESITGPSFTNTAEWMRWFGAADTTAQTTIRSRFYSLYIYYCCDGAKLFFFFFSDTFQNIASLYSPSNTHSIPVLPGVSWCNLPN
jgi:hypothetical protein